MRQIGSAYVQVGLLPVAPGELKELFMDMSDMLQCSDFPSAYLGYYRNISIDYSVAGGVHVLWEELRYQRGGGGRQFRRF